MLRGGSAASVTCSYEVSLNTEEEKVELQHFHHLLSASSVTVHTVELERPPLCLLPPLLQL